MILHVKRVLALRMLYDLDIANLVFINVLNYADSWLAVNVIQPLKRTNCLRHQNVCRYKYGGLNVNKAYSDDGDVPSDGDPPARYTYMY